MLQECMKVLREGAMDKHHVIRDRFLASLPSIYANTCHSERNEVKRRILPDRQEFNPFQPRHVTINVTNSQSGFFRVTAQNDSEL